MDRITSFAACANASAESCAPYLAAIHGKVKSGVCVTLINAAAAEKARLIKNPNCPSIAEIG